MPPVYCTRVTVCAHRYPIIHRTLTQYSMRSLRDDFFIRVFVFEPSLDL